MAQSKIFISYRRGDTSAYAGRIYDRLADRYGEDQVFIDVDTIEPGADFVEYIEDAVGSCDVLVAVIGKDWSTATNPDGSRRLDDPEDFVRLEVSAGLERNVRVIPVLVEGATMPSSTELPGPLGKLARRNALDISDLRFRHDVGRLIETIDKVLGGREPGSVIAEVEDIGAVPASPQAATAAAAATPPPAAVQPAAPFPPPPPAASTAGYPTAPSPTHAPPAGNVYVVDDAKRATFALWLSIGSVLLSWLVVGVLLAIPAIALGRRVQKNTPVDASSYRAKATAAIYIGAAGCVLAVVFLLNILFWT